MKVLLIEPPFHRFMGFYRFFFPFSLSSLAAYIKREGHHVLIYDADHGDHPVNMTSTDLLNVFHKYLDGIRDLDHPIWQEAKNVIKEFQPDIIGITFMSTKLGAVYNLIKICKQLFPHIPVVLGGAHPSILYRSPLENTQADFIIVGEGEITFSELLRKIEDGATDSDYENIQGLVYRAAAGNIKVTPPRALIQDLDSLPFPDRESLYQLETYRPDDLSMIMTSRGCPFNCAFCSSIWERRARNRSIANIVAEMEMLVEQYQTRNIYFKDDTFTLNRKRVFQFCDTLEQKQLNVDWECLTRIELVDEEMLLRMRQVGMVYLKIGIETGSQRLLTATHKNITIEEVKKGADILNKLGQKWSAFFMLGFPDESEEEIRMTWELIEEIKPTYVSMSIMAPYPGCQYYHDLKEIGAINADTDWNLYDPFSLYANVNQKIKKPRFQELARATMKFVDEYNLQSKDNSPKIT